jgi:hypothetical protein
MEKTQVGVLKQQLNESCMQLMKLLEDTKSFSQAEEKLGQSFYLNSAIALKEVLRKAAESLEEAILESPSKYESGVESFLRG